MTPSRVASLVYDVRARAPYDGSCGMVTYALRRALGRLGYDIAERYVPLSDKTTKIVFNPTRRSYRTGVRACFEELFPRCQQDAEFLRYPNFAFFNLAFFSQLEATCTADGVLFNSPFLMRCFLAEVENRGLRAPPVVDWAPLPLPLLDFPNGYPTSGASINRAAIGELKRTSFVGHAVRPRKQDTFATLAIIHHLNRIARERRLKPFSLVISNRDVDDYRKTLRSMPLPRSTFDHFFPVAHLTNRSLVSLMRSSDFALCYDQILEAFGYYPAESVYCGSPVFTNGAGNLRHLLPAGHGIFTEETVAMHVGDAASRVASYRSVAESICAAVVSGDGAKACERGIRYLEKHHTNDALQKKLRTFLRRLPGARSSTQPAARGRIEMSPMVRLADWERGVFVTDRGTVEAGARLSAWRAAFDRKDVSDAVWKRANVDPRVLVRYRARAS